MLLIVSGPEAPSTVSRAAAASGHAPASLPSYASASATCCRLAAAVDSDWANTGVASNRWTFDKNQRVSELYTLHQTPYASVWCWSVHGATAHVIFGTKRVYKRSSASAQHITKFKVKNIHFMFVWHEEPALERYCKATTVQQHTGSLATANMYPAANITTPKLIGQVPPAVPCLLHPCPHHACVPCPCSLAASFPPDHHPPHHCHLQHQGHELCTQHSTA